MSATKTLIIVRHAKSSWESASLTDFERPLNDRGKRDAPMMAKRLKDRKVHIDLFVSSPAKRAKKTAELFCEVYDYPLTEIDFISKLYHASADTFFEVVEALPDEAFSIALFSHNTGLTEFVNLLVSNVQIVNVPTCGIFAISVAAGKWSDFRSAAKEFLFFDYPKLEL